MQNYNKKGTQKVSKRVTGFPGWRPWGRLGRPLTPQSVFEHKKYAQSAPKMTSRVQKWPQNASKVTPKVAKCTLTGAPKWFKCIKKCQLQDTRPGGLREALTITLCEAGLLYICADCYLRQGDRHTTFLQNACVGSKTCFSYIKFHNGYEWF